MLNSHLLHCIILILAYHLKILKNENIWLILILLHQRHSEVKVVIFDVLKIVLNEQCLIPVK